MRPILPGARGPAVEDIQRRLLKMGFDLGPTGVDGVFLGMTRDAVVAFQRGLGLQEDGTVGEETWSALVDSTFTLGDRTLYLRLPHFHGHDVTVLQEALSALGFSSGAVDGIFGPSTEHALSAFQRSCGQPSDGIAGPATIACLMNLRHVWEGKAGAPVGSIAVGTVRSLEVLRAKPVAVDARGDNAREVAERFVNLALASAQGARVSLGQPTESEPSGYVLLIVGSAGDADPGIPMAELGTDSREAFAARLRTAVSSAGGPGTIGIDIGHRPAADEELQRVAARILDATCIALA